MFNWSPCIINVKSLLRWHNAGWQIIYGRVVLVPCKRVGPLGSRAPPGIWYPLLLALTGMTHERQMLKLIDWLIFHKFVWHGEFAVRALRIIFAKSHSAPLRPYKLWSEILTKTHIKFFVFFPQNFVIIVLLKNWGNWQKLVTIQTKETEI